MRKTPSPIKMNTLTRALALTLTLGGPGCMDYDGLTSTVSTNQSPENAEGNDPFGDENYGSGIPSYSFGDAIDACLGGLEENDCTLFFDEAGPDASCTKTAVIENAAMETSILTAARERSGDSSLNMEEIKDGAVPAVVRATHSIGSSRSNNEPIWLEWASIIISFYEDESLFDDENFGFPFDPLPAQTLRCWAFQKSYDVDQEPSEVEMIPDQVGTWTEEADGNTSGALSIIDFSENEESNTLKVFGIDYDTSDPNQYTAPGKNALKEETKNTLSAAHTLTGGDSVAIHIF
jgi:hypothetical protein